MAGLIEGHVRAGGELERECAAQIRAAACRTKRDPTVANSGAIGDAEKRACCAAGRPDKSPFRASKPSVWSECTGGPQTFQSDKGRQQSAAELTHKITI